MKLALFGYGRMGRAVEEVARDRGHQVDPILDEPDNPKGRGITPESLAGARVAVDFSVAGAVADNVRAAARHGVNVVVGTTGWDAEKEAVEEAVRSAGTAILSAPNFSIGMLLFERIVRSAARLVDGARELEAYDVHLSESHHRMKTDHPSGTARRLAELLVGELDAKTDWSAVLEEGVAVDQACLHVGVSRIGSVFGTHSVGIDGPNDRIVLEHQARSRAGFARGAVLAAEWIRDRSGIFTMGDVLRSGAGNG